MGVGKGDKQTHCAPHFPLPRPVASVKFSANKRRRGRQDREERCKKDREGQERQQLEGQFNRW